MIDITRSRVSHFMKKFRELSLISYNGHIEVYSSLLHAVLRDKLELKEMIGVRSHSPAGANLTAGPNLSKSPCRATRRYGLLEQPREYRCRIARDRRKSASGGLMKTSDAARRPWLRSDEASAFQRQHNLVNRSRADPEILPHVGFGRGPAMQPGVEVDKGQMLPLRGREGFLSKDSRRPSDSVVRACLERGGTP
jgi:hypothetical protein